MTEESLQKSREMIGNVGKLIDAAHRLKMRDPTYDCLLKLAREISGLLGYAEELKRELLLVTQERETGEWEKIVENEGKTTHVYWRCTACKKVHFLEPPRAAYCQGCGAKMKECIDK